MEEPCTVEIDPKQDPPISVSLQIPPNGGRGHALRFVGRGRTVGQAAKAADKLRKAFLATRLLPGL